MRAGRRRLYLARHGDVSYYDAEGNVVADPDQVPLNQRGQQQAKALGDALSDVTFDCVYHTGMPRTIETAALIAGTEHPGTARNALREIAPGQIGHLGHEIVLRELVYGFELANEPGAQFARGERFAEFYDRISAGTDLLLGESWSTCLLVAHSGTNRAMLSYLCRMGPGGMSHFEQDAGCLNVIDVDELADSSRQTLIRLANFTPSAPVPKGDRRTSLERMFANRDRD
ncbi:MAG: histidine phosphatase family protein [Pseudomonadota bacterium]